MPPAFLLDLQDLDAAGKVLKAPLPVTWLRSALEGTDLSPRGDDGSFEVRYSRSGTDVIVRGRVRASLQIPCARCLEPVAVDIDTELSLLLVPATGPRADFARGKKAEAQGKKAEAPRKDEEYELQSGDADLDVYDGEQVVLDGFLREAILLEVPSFPLCSDGCRGIAPPPPEEGQGPAIDPRLAPLLKFKKQGN